MAAENDQNGKNGKKRRMGRRAAIPSLDAPTLGYIPATPATPAPVLADPIGDAANAYQQTLDKIREATTARILMVTAGDPGLGPTMTSVNLAMAATRAGMRAVVIDGYESGDGPSRFLSTGAGPGLTDLVDGSSTLADASRLIQIDNEHRLPIVAAGGDAGATFGPADIADAVDLISEHSDLVLISLDAAATDERATALGAHADGSLLVVDEGRSMASAAEAVERMADVGAPVVGIIERATQKKAKGRRR